MGGTGDEVQQVLDAGVADGTFPGGSACAAWRGPGGPVRRAWVAGVRAPQQGAVTEQTPYDLASLTKSFVACTALRLSEQGLDLGRPLGDFVPEVKTEFAGDKPLSDLMAHRAGLTPWGGFYREIPGGPGSVEARQWLIREAASRADPNPPAAPAAVYSDLGYILLGEALGRHAGLDLAALVRREVLQPLGLDALGYAAALPDEAARELRAQAPPTEYCDSRGRLVRGEVHDENCAAFGGVAGHAGMFGPAGQVLDFGLELLSVLRGESSWLSEERLRWALAPRPGGGYVAGFDTKSRQGSSAGGKFSEDAFGHLGFTGTSLWCDPQRDLCAVLLSNRVHPTRDNIQIRALRPRFHDAVVAAFKRSMSRD